jgi:SSS family solute:Na+ symporter
MNLPTPLLFAAAEKSSALISIGRLDYLIIAIYFIVVLGIGLYLKKYVSTGEDFFLAGRKMTAWIAGLSFISANLSSLETMGWSAMAYQYGMLGAHAYLIGGGACILFLAIVMMPFYYICKTHSVPGYLKLRYGEASRTLAGVSFSVMTVMVSGASMFAMAKMLHLLLDWPMRPSIWVASLTVAVYVTLGGLISAVFNEVLQFFLIWFGSLLIPILGLIQAGGWSRMMAKIQENVKVIHPGVPGADFTCLWHNLGSFDANPMGVDWFGMVFGMGLALSCSYWCTDFLQVQRVIVAKNLRAAQNGTLIGAVLKMCVPLIVTVPGLLGLAVLMNKSGGPLVLVPESDPSANITQHTYNDVLPLLMGRYLGPGLLGLGVTAMIAGFMSGMAGNVSAFATVWTYDVYKPLFVKNASDRHYLNMGRWSSLVGVLLSIGTAETLFWFANILDYLQVLITFFIVPLFGVVIVGMLWKRATPAGGFWGFLTGILLSISMWGFVHTFPQGYRPEPTIVVGPVVENGQEEAAVLSVERGSGDDAEKIVKVIVHSGTLETTNVPIFEGEAKEPITAGKLTVATGGASLPATVAGTAKPIPVRLLAKGAIVRDSADKGIGVEGVPVELALGVAVQANDVLQYFNPKTSAMNPDHTQWIARSPKAQSTAVNMYAGFWTLLASVLVTVGVSLFTRPKPEAELRNLVMGLTPRPDEGPCPWYQRPMLWAAIVAAALVAINVIFW